jgi:hypothetical protein
MNSTELEVFEQSFLKYSRLWNGKECSHDQGVLDFANSLRANMLINYHAEFVYLPEYQKKINLFLAHKLFSEYLNRIHLMSTEIIA